MVGVAVVMAVVMAVLFGAIVLILVDVFGRPRRAVPGSVRSWERGLRPSYALRSETRPGRDRAKLPSMVDTKVMMCAKGWHSYGRVLRWIAEKTGYFLKGVAATLRPAP